MISHRKKFLFIHIPKTGGNSVQEVLKEHSEQQIVTRRADQDGVDRFGVVDPAHPKLTKHATLRDYYDAYGRQILSYYIFTTIRNPFDRLVSYYFSPHRGDVAWQADDFARFCLDVAPLEHFACHSYTRMFVLRRPVLVRRYIHFERLQDDFLEVCRDLQIEADGLQHRNKSRTRDPGAGYREYFSDDLRRQIEERHAFEMSLGGYRF